MAQRLGVGATAKRIDILRRHIAPSKLFLRHCKSDATVTIGDVSVKVSHSENVCFVPHKYVLAEFPQSVLRHLKWMAQKDALCQDMFLIGPPGPLRRALAFMYLELTNRESEYIALSRDTTESDLKQRREIKDGTAFYIDQCAVRAAVSGRVLVLDGIEKAERNVLPILNNLLENREMQLEDGRFLMRADTYDKLLTSHSKDVLNSWRLVRVSENFRVIALGLPVPRYIGNPLDPPLRSRFQSRDVGSLPFKDLMHLLLLEGPRAPEVKLTELVSFAMALNQPDAQNLGLPDFPINSLTHAARILSTCPAVSPSRLVTSLYPHALVLKSEAQAAVDDMRKKFELGSSAEGASAKRLSPEVQIVRTSSHSAHLTIKENSSESATIEVSVGDKDLNGSRYTYIPTPHHDSVLVEMLHSHVTSDFCIVGTKGCGKTALVNKFADLLGYHVEPIMLYQDMTSRDLLQQRTTLPNGDTVWRHSPLVTAALMGHLAVLDGVHRLHPGALSVLSRLVHDRELNLMDGSRLLRADRFEEIQRKTGLNEGELNERAVFKIHPAFRIVAVAEPPVLGGPGGTGQWLTPEMLTMFLFHSMKPLSIQEEEHVLLQLAPNTPATSLAALLKLTDQLRTSHDTMCRSLAASLSTRQLLRIARRMSQYPEDSLREAVSRACLSRFLPHLPKMALDQIMDDLQIKSDPQASPDDIPTSIEVKDGFVRIGRTAAPVYIGSKAEGLAKIPDILFYENVQHSAALETMLKDYAVGEHLLLIGNQGVGKNKLADRFLQLLGRPREYVQLHRDTTVQTLTLQPTVRDGAIVYDDSPLVKAVRDGLVLVIDEADKAPTNVTCILKTLVESGQMLLADGRKIVSDPADVAAAGAASRIIPMHPDFRMIVLANRPGFPFLGNDFFSSMGDAFACHAIDNPDVRSEIAMLQRYAPDVPEATLRRLVLAFGELRTLADQGLIAYPYSTREVVAVAKHLQKYPSDGLTTSVRNVFDFDSYNKEMKDMVIDTLHKHGIPIGVAATNVQLAREFPLPELKLTASWTTGGSCTQITAEVRRLKLKGPAKLAVNKLPLSKHDMRSTVFTEQKCMWKLPLQDGASVCSAATVLGAKRHADRSRDLIHVVTTGPAALYTFAPADDQAVTYVDLYDVLTDSASSYIPSLKVAPMGAAVHDTVVVFDASWNIALIVNTSTGSVNRIETALTASTASERLSRRFLHSAASGGASPYRMCADQANTPDGWLAFYKENGHELTLVSMLEGTCTNLTVPVAIHSLSMPRADVWLLLPPASWLPSAASGVPPARAYIIKRIDDSHFSLEPVTEKSVTTGGGLLSALSGAQPGLSEDALASALPQERATSKTSWLLACRGGVASIAAGFLDVPAANVYCSHRAESAAYADDDQSVGSSGAAAPAKHHVPASAVELACSPAVLAEAGLLVQALHTGAAPPALQADAQRTKRVAGFMEMADLVNRRLRYLAVPSSESASSYGGWLPQTVPFFVLPLTGEAVATVDVNGTVRQWDVSQSLLSRSLREWRSLIGEPDQQLQLTINRENSKEANGPKHGKVDPTNEPHVGGNTWAGGTGGRDTAGLGGVGGPYRLDGGHNVFQVSQEDKDAVPEHIREAAREMGQKAYKERLQQIKMSEYDANVYERFSRNVRKQVTSMRVVLDSLQAKAKERQWLRNQTHGDLDDARIIEGLTGERSIYRRRGEREPDAGSVQEKPKRLRLLADVSGSMYRFNGHDGRLEREMECVCMVMEALQGYEHKVKYDIVGHSGETYHVDLVSADKPPQNNKQRLDVLLTMQAHSQFCLSGDHTLSATTHAVEQIHTEDADERFVIVLSDANLERYGIRPQRFAEVLTKSLDEGVNTYVLFIGSLGDQAQRLVKQLPSGHAFVVMDTSQLPVVLQQIFASTMVK